MAEMILFNGVMLEDIAPVMVEDIRVSPIPVTVTARQRPINWGASFVRTTGGSRTVSITFALLTEDKDARRNELDQIRKWAYSDSPQRLYLNTFENRFLEVICTSYPEPSMRQWWESKLRLVFTTYDNPFWTSDVEQTATCGTAFTVLGDAPPLMRITNTFAESASDQVYSDGTDTLTFTTIPAGNFEIDLNHMTAKVGTASIMSNFAFGSRFIKPQTGTHTITGTGTVLWRERWL